MKLTEQNKLMRGVLGEIARCAGTKQEQDAWSCLDAIGPAPIAAEVASIDTPKFYDLLYAWGEAEVNSFNVLRDHIHAWRDGAIQQAVADALAEQEAEHESRKRRPFNALDAEALSHQRAEKAEAERDAEVAGIDTAENSLELLRRVSAWHRATPGMTGIAAWRELVTFIDARTQQAVADALARQEAQIKHIYRERDMALRAARGTTPHEVVAAARDLMDVLDRYDGQLVPINRNSVTCNALRAALAAATP